MRQAVAFSIVLSTCLLLPFGAQAQQVFTGEGRAVLGSAMTPAETRDLALEKARQDALQKFGAHVLSEQTVSSVEDGSGREELTTEKVAVLAAGNAELISKEIDREPTEETVVYTARAEYRIEPTDFEKTLKAYLRTGESSPVNIAVRRAIDEQSRLSKERMGPGETREIISETREAQNLVTAVAEKFDGKGQRREIAEERTRRQNALLRYLDVVKRRGAPHELLSFHIFQKSVEDQSSSAKFEIRLNMQKTRRADAVLQSCRETRPIWGQGERLEDDGWLQEAFGGDYWKKFEIEHKPLLMLLLDKDGDVLAAVGKTSSGMRSPPTFYFRYWHCNWEDLVYTRLDFDHWTFEAPTSILEKVDRILPLIAESSYEESLERQGYKEIDHLIWTGEGASRFGLRYRGVSSMVRSHARRVKEINQ